MDSKSPEQEKLPYWIKKREGDGFVSEYFKFRSDADSKRFAAPTSYHNSYWEEISEQEFEGYLNSKRYSYDELCSRNGDCRFWECKEDIDLLPSSATTPRIITADALQVGNIISYAGEIVIVTAIDEEDCRIKSVSGGLFSAPRRYELLKPMELLSSTGGAIGAGFWFKRFGFTNDCSTKIVHRWDADDLGHPEFGYTIFFDKYPCYGKVRYYSERDIPCEYVHQFQNLYQALFQEKLIFNPNI